MTSILKKMIGSSIGKITIVDCINEKQVLCQCDCGKHFMANGYLIRSGRIRSCGCLKRKTSSNIGRMTIVNNSRNRIERNKKYGTSVGRIMNGKISKSNTSGYTGISLRKNGKYQSYIGFNGKNIYLGMYSNISDAISARKEAEQKYYEPIISQYINDEINK